MPFLSNPAAAAQESIHARPILALADLRQSDIALGGGKAANLGELINAGLNVPPGFVLTTTAYSHFVNVADLDKALHAWLTTLAPADGDYLHNAFVNSPMPADLGDMIRNAYRQLGNNVPVAVRSSATAEDLPGATFAGQQETYLNVCGEEALLEAVRNCWASLWTERATLYRSKQNVDQRAVKLAVVVQRMVMAEVAGVLFTADPVTGERDIAVLDANPGLGEAVVAGMVTPDHFVIHKPTLQIRQRVLGAHEVELRPRTSGGFEEIHRHNHSDQPSLSDAQLRELAQLGNRIEQHYGAPQDIEWAWADGQFYILQARPITALPPAVVTPPAASARKARRPGPDPAELFAIRPYPLDCDTHTRNLLRGVLNSIGGPLGMFIPTLEDVLEIEDGVVVRGKGVGMRPTWRLLYKPWLSLWQRRGTDLRQWASDPIIMEAKQRAQRLETQDFSQLAWPQLLQTMQAALELENFICQLRQHYFIVAFCDTLFLHLWLGLAGQRKRFAQLTAGMDNITLAINQALEDLAEQIRQNPTWKEVFVAEDTASLVQRLQADTDLSSAAWQPLRDAFAAFLAEFGSREALITLMSQPTWKDAPEVPLGILKHLVIAENRAISPSSSAETAWETTRDELLSSTWLGKASFRNTFVRSLEKARHFVPMRENTHFYLSLPMPSERRAALEMGRRLAENGVLAAAEDVFHLRLAELQRIQDPAQLTAEQRQALAGNVAKRKQRRAELIDQPLFTEPHETPSTVDATALLTGIGGSPGIVEGVVRVILRPQEFDQLQKGEILVAPYTNPAWTPLFLRAAAAIVDTGSTMSHAAIVTREYGIPAVLGTRTATRLLKNGQRVRVDGTKGTVHAV